MDQDNRVEVQPLWRGNETCSGRTSIAPRPFATRILLVATGLLVAVAVAAGMLGWLVGVPDTHFVSCSVTKFRDPTIPPNPAIDCDLLALRQGNFFARTDVASMPVQSKFLMTQHLNALAEDSRSNNVVLHVATYAIVDGDGRIVLLTSDYDPGQPDSGLPLNNVLRSLEKSPARHKLLVLDISWPNLLPAVTGGAGDVTAVLSKELHSVPDPDRLVLCACSPGQVALTSETIGRSVFGYYFEQALRGDADQYNADRFENGRVTVREAARLIAARVDRWAMKNRSCRQTPLLLGEGEDFDLAVCDVHPLVAPAPAKVPKYPEWLLAGWKLREQWLAEGTSRLAPRVFHQLEAHLLRVERKWQFERADEELEVTWEKTCVDLKREIALYASHASGPAPVSLASVVAAGHVADPKVTDATSALVEGFQAIPPSAKPADGQATLQKLLAEFDKQTKDAAGIDVALGVFDASVTLTQAEPDRLSVLTGVLRQRRLCDEWVETRFLDQLALYASASQAETWDSSQASRLLRVVQQSEQAYCHSDAMPWTADQLEAAAQGRHNAVFRFWSPGYIPADAVEQAIRDAESLAENAAAHQAVFVDAWTTYAKSMGALPWYSQYVDRYPAGIAAWSSAVDATSGLAELLEAQAITASGKHATDAKDLDAIRRATKDARTAMEAVLAPFDSDSVTQLVRRCEVEDARPNVFREIDAVLATPLLTSGDRVKLWLARAQLSCRFHDRLALMDYDDAKNKQKTPVLSGYDPVAGMRDEAALAAVRARVSLDLLRLGGVPIDGTLYADLKDDSSQLTCEQADTIARLWHGGLRKQIEAAERIGRQDRLSRVFPPLCPMGLLDDVDSNPTLHLITWQRRDLWAWQAGRYRYETRDGVDPEFYAKLAVQFAPYQEKTPEPSLQIDGPATLADLTAGALPVPLSIPWTISGGADEKSTVTVDVMNPATPWLTVLRKGPSDAHESLSPVLLDVSLRRGTEPTQVPPRGFAIIWTAGGRTYHHLVNVPALADESHLTILLSSNPKQPEPVIDRIQLRSNPTPTAFHLFVRNDGPKSETVLVELSTGALTAAPLEISAGQAVPVKFAPPAEGAAGPSAPQAKTAAKELPELDGPLKVVVRDATSHKELSSAVFPIDIVEPRQFVTVDSVRFSPKDDNHNRLEVELRENGQMPGPPCLVQLDVDAAHVPGLVGMGDGVFKGKLPANGDPLVLFARNLRLADGTSEQGSFSLTIDGVPRTIVFDTTFARSGNATTPVEAIRPAMRLSAPPTGRSGGPFAALIETDYAPASGTLELGLGRKSLAGRLEMDNVVRLSGGRQRRVGFSSAGKGGALLFTALIADWNVPLDTSGIVGHRVLQARLLSSDGREIAVARQEVVLGDRPPQGVAFENVPKLASNKEPLELSASVLQSIPEVSSVTFFVGKPENDAIPKNAVTAQAKPDAADQTWSGQIALKPTVKGTIPVSAQFTNAAGLSSFITTTVEVTDADVGGAEIEGKVVEGSIPQSGVEVVLADGKGAALAKATTGSDGSFTFKSLKPGSYTTSAAKPTSGRRGSAAVEVKEDSIVEATIELWL